MFILYLVHPFFFGTTDHVNTLGTEGGKWKFRAVSFGCSGSRGEGLWKPQPLTAPLPGQQRVIEVVAPVGIAVDAFRAAQVRGQRAVTVDARVRKTHVARVETLRKSLSCPLCVMYTGSHTRFCDVES